MKKFLTAATLLQCLITGSNGLSTFQQCPSNPARDAERSVERLERYEYRNPITQNPAQNLYYQNLGSWEERARGHW